MLDDVKADWIGGEVAPDGDRREAGPASTGCPVRELAEEVAVALTYNGSTHAVMMATPEDIEDFAIGFSLTEGIVEHRDDLLDIEVGPTGTEGIDVRIWLRASAGARLSTRRRRMAGPVGCGLCGLDSLAEAARDARPVSSGAFRLDASAVSEAMSALEEAQRLNRRTHAVHAAGLWSETEGLVAIREDVGRHNALDKLCGVSLRTGQDASRRVLLMTSRVSVDLIQKAAVLGTPILVAVSAPTTLAVRTAEACGMTLIGIARRDGFEVFSHPERIVGADR